MYLLVLSTYNLCLALQLLVDWTRGRNIIISSAAPTANEFRGPYDVANLMSLLGLSMERAKAAISRNCRYDSFHKCHSAVDMEICSSLSFLNECLAGLLYLMQ